MQIDKKSIYLVLIYLLYCCLSDLNAQQHYQFYDIFTTQDGLPGNSITSLMQDSKGYLWIGTTNGLAKYDGNKFTIFEQTNDTNSIGGHKISALYEDKQGIIWVGSAGLNRYDRKNNSWKRYVGLTRDTIGISNEFVSSVIQENDSIIWYLTLNGLNRLNKNTEQFDFFAYPGNMRNQRAKIIHIVPGKQIIISYLGGNFNLSFDIKSKKFKKKLLLSVKSGINKGRFTRIEAILNEEYIGLFLKKENEKIRYLAKFNKQQNTFKLITEIKSKIFHKSILKNDNKLIFLTTDYVNIYNEKFELIDSTYIGNIETSNNFSVYCLHREKNNTVWIGSNFGLYRVNPKKSFHFINKTNGLTNEYIRSVLNDSHNQIYLGTGKGHIYKMDFMSDKTVLNRFNIKYFNFLPYYDRITYNNKIIELTDHKILFVTATSLILYDKDKDIPIAYHENKFHSNYWSAIETSDGVLVGGINYPPFMKFVIKDNIIKLDTVLESFGSSISAFSMYKDREEQIWIGGQGLFKMNYNINSKKYKFENYLSFDDQKNKNKNPVWGILDLNKDTLIVGTSENGFFLLDKNTKSYKHYTTAQGLSSDVVSGFLKDKQGNIWISTINGLNVFKRKENKIISFYDKDGLIDNDFNFKACDQNSNGWMFFGTKKGVVYFHPDSILEENFEFPLYINEFKILDEVIRRELKSGDEIILNHKQNFFTLEFSLLDFRNPKETVYEYFLENYDHNIRITDGTNPRAGYTNVPPGKYVFKLKAVDPKDSTIKNQLEIPIHIEPAFYQTLVFKLLIALIIIFILSAVIFQYIKRQSLSGKLYKLELDLLRSQMNPHFIFNIMSAIQGIVMKNEKIKAVDYLAKFARLMRMNLDYSLSEHASIDKTVQFLETYVKLESLNLDEPIDFTIHVDDLIDKEKFLVSPMLIQPFIENAVIHGLSSKNKDMKLTLSMKKEGEFILCTINDNGIGRKESYKLNAAKQKGHESVGIEITKRRNLLQLKKYKIKDDCIEIIDHYDKTGNASGTEVKLKIAYELNP